MIEIQQQLYQGHKLTVGGEKDPLLPKLIQAINHASEIEITVSFIQPSGLNLLFDPLLEAIRRDTTIKILVSDYLSISSPIALRKLSVLQEIGAQTKVFQCEQGKSFHMKSYIFVKTKYGEIIEGCAFVGSNNISKTALTHAHEWCLRHDYELPTNALSTLEFTHIREQFNHIFNHSQSHHLSHKWLYDYAIRYEKINNKSRLSLVNESFNIEPFEPVTPNSAQELALNKLHNSREKGFKRGLVVLATGMGKTWLSAFDVKQMEAKKVLFVAHREEILLQAEQTFLTLFKNINTGLYNAKNRMFVDKNTACDYLFASVQTLGKSKNLEKFTPNHFDYIVIDEFHHASTPTYKNLLGYFKPQFMLGLTATPERSDQADILSLCDNNLVFERNLVHGIDEKILVPFEYHGIYDEFVNYEEIPWRNGKFNPQQLDNALATKQRTQHIYKNWLTKKQTRTLAFCVSTKHADYMAQAFINKGVTACAVYNGSIKRRNEALTQLATGKLQIIFSVDLFNEGTDLPAIDTILMLRPTDSKILFLQQLGRGLRQSVSTNKSHLTVIDFIGNHKSFLNKPASLLGVTDPRKIVQKANAKFKLTDNCFINYDPKILAFWQQLAKKYRNTSIEEYQLLKDQLAHRPTATEFFQAENNLTKMRTQCKSWFELVRSQEADLIIDNNQLLAELLDKHGEFLLNAIEKASMTKSFKAILLLAFLELDGFTTAPSTKTLAIKSGQILSRRPDLKAQELPNSIKQHAVESKDWHNYWLNNPIKAFTKIQKKQTQAWFNITNGIFTANFNVQPQHILPLSILMQELVDLRLAEYKIRLAKRDNRIITKENKLEPSLPIVPIPSVRGTVLSFYTDLKIACGHFKTSNHELEESYLVPDGYGHLNSDIHFIAKASGNSMNGGKISIKDGDLLLLEWITSNNAGSISNQTLAIEIQDSAGDNQYLLRTVKKQPNGEYLLHANNLNYTEILATENMKTFARLKAVLKTEC